MATEADIPATKNEQGGNIADDATNIVITKIPQEEKTQADTRNEPPTVEGDNFLGTPSIGEVRCEVINISPDASMVAEKPDQTVKDDTEILLPSKPKLGDQPLEIAGSEEIPSERIQQNAEESNDSEKGEDRGVLPVEYSMYSGGMTSGMQAGDILHDPDLDDLRVETQLSKDTISDHHCVNDSIAKQMALSKENLQEASLPGGEKEFNIQVKATNDANGDGEKTEEDISLNLTNENLHRIEEKVGQENSTLADATSSSDELLSKNESNSSFSQEDDKAVPTSEGSGILLENIVDESQVAVESQSRNLEGFDTTHGNTNITEKTEDCSLVRVDGPEIQCDEQLEQESEELPVPDVLTGSTNDNESAIVDKVKDEDEDLEEAEMTTKSFQEEHRTDGDQQGITSDNSEENKIDTVDTKKEILESFSTIVSTPPEEGSIDANLQEATSDSTAEKMIDELDQKRKFLREDSDDGSTVEQETRIEDGDKVDLCENETSRENMKIQSKIEKPEDSLDGTSENIKPSDLGQEIETRVSADEESLAANPQGILDENTDKEIVSAAEIKEETPELQNFAPIVSNEKTNESSLMQGDGSQKEDEEHLEKESEKPSSIEDFTGNTNDDDETIMDDVKIEDETPRRPELFEEEKNIENTLLKELQIDQNFQVSDSGQHTEKTGFIEEQSLIENPQGNPGDVEEKTDTADTDEKTQEVQNVSLNVSNEDNDQSSLIQSIPQK
ncbi:UNVERIFIED_CONTAM: hypothetical protein Sradi_4253400 [Sesamum radiatum]|uniref:Uncharacterized protein n=1 Tax=Sesamum radiatum TaxID=300843 RepID=A0AAW2P7Q6_SESRA